RIIAFRHGFHTLGTQERGPNGKVLVSGYRPTQIQLLETFHRLPVGSILLTGGVSGEEVRLYWGLKALGFQPATLTLDDGASVSTPQVMVRQVVTHPDDW